MFMGFTLLISCPPSPLPLFVFPTCTDTRTHMLHTHESHHDLTTQALCHVRSLVWCTRCSLHPLGCSLKCSVLHSEGSCLHSNNSIVVLVPLVSFYQFSLKQTHMIEIEMEIAKRWRLHETPKCNMLSEQVPDIHSVPMPSTSGRPRAKVDSS